MAGITITADSGTQFEAGAAEYNSIARLTDDSYVIAYRDNNDYNKGKVNVGSRTGTSVTISEANAVIFNNDDTTYVQIRVLSSTAFVISYCDTNTGKIYVIAGTISGTTITLGSAVQAGSYTINPINSVAVLDSTNFVVLYQNYTPTLAMVGSVSGTTITLGSQQTTGFGSDSAHIDSVGLDATHFVYVFFNGGGTYSVAGTVDTGAKTITFGAVSGFSSGLYAYHPKISKFDSEHFIVAVMQEVGSAVIQVYAGAVNLTTLNITVGGWIYTANTTTTLGNYSICTINGYSFLVAYYTTTGTQGEIISGTLTGDTTIAFDAQGAVIFDNSTSAYTTLCRLTDNYFLLGYKKG